MKKKDDVFTAEMLEKELCEMACSKGSKETKLPIRFDNYELVMKILS